MSTKRKPKLTLVQVPQRRATVERIYPKTENQSLFLEALESSQLVVATGAAGTGKTYCAVNFAVNKFIEGRFKRIILTRPNVSTGRSLGFFPGDIKEKMAPWLAPMISILRSRLEYEYDYHYKTGSIQIQPLEVIRGASFEDSIILVDEAQNLNYEEIKALTTRLGEGSQMVLMGDLMQRDISTSGLTRFKDIVFQHKLPVPCISFSADDIVRSDLVAILVKAFMREEGLL
jgi:phosphate starvation-inducible protein PhoH and related proteins